MQRLLHIKFNTLPFSLKIWRADETFDGDLEAKKLNDLMLKGELEFKDAAHVWNHAGFKAGLPNEVRAYIWRIVKGKA